MKRAAVFFLILVLVPGLSPAQDYWQQTSGPNGGKILSLGNRYFMGPIFAGTADSGLYRTEDIGDTWIKTALRDTMVNSILINSIWQIFVGTADSGLFIAENNGDIWIQTDERLKKCSVRCMTFNPIENTFLGTADSGIFRSPDFGIYGPRSVPGKLNTAPVWSLP